MSSKIMGSALAWILLAALAGCNQSPQSKGPVQRPPSQASLQWQQTADGFVRDYFAAQPFFAALSGKHEFDGQLPDLSAHGIKREIARLHDQRDQLTAVDPSQLEPRERFDREYLLSVVDHDLFWLEKAHFPSTNPYWYLGSIDPDLYVSRNYAPLGVRMKAFIKFARGLPKMVTDIQANLQGPLPKAYVEQGITEFGGFVEFVTVVWWTAGGVCSSLFDALAARRRPQPGLPAQGGLPPDMSTTSLVGGGLIAGDALAAVSIAVYGLLGSLHF